MGYKWDKRFGGVISKRSLTHDRKHLACC